MKNLILNSKYLEETTCFIITNKGLFIFLNSFLNFHLTNTSSFLFKESFY